MVELSVSTNVADVIRQLSAVQQRQVPFAAAQALTFTALDVQAQVRRDMRQDFTIRRDWVISGIRVTPATKRP
jgi:hypothetical protein